MLALSFWLALRSWYVSSFCSGSSSLLSLLSQTISLLCETWTASHSCRECWSDMFGSGILEHPLYHSCVAGWEKTGNLQLHPFHTSSHTSTLYGKTVNKKQSYCTARGYLLWQNIGMHLPSGKAHGPHKPPVKSPPSPSSSERSQYSCSIPPLHHHKHLRGKNCCVLCSPVATLRLCPGS